jgi:hypothetical protein
VNSDETGFPWGEAEDDLASRVDTSVPVSARIWNYWLGGKDFYPVDQVAGDAVAKMDPGQFTLARSCRYFTGRVVRFLAGEAGVRQFLDIGTGLPSHDNTHEIAQRVAPAARVVYVDNDPLVLAHARALLTGTPPGTTDYISGDLNEPAAILEVARRKLDFSRPVAIMLMGILGHIGNPAEDGDRYAQAIVRTLKDALPPGSYVAIYEGVDTDPVHSSAIDHYNQSGAVPFHLRSPSQIARFLDGLELIEPGVVPIHQWRPDPSPFEATPVPSIGGIGRK